MPKVPDRGTCHPPRVALARAVSTLARGGGSSHLRIVSGLGDPLPDARDGLEPSEGVSERGHHPVHLGVEMPDGSGQLVHPIEVHPGEEAVVVVPSADEGSAQLGDLRSSAMSRHPGSLVASERF